MNLLAWAAILLAVGLALVVLEAFIPSHGLLGILAACALAASFFMAFKYSPLIGASFLGIMIVAIPSIVVFALKRLPNTPIGRMIMLSAPEEDEVLPDVDQGLQQMVGQVGKAKTMMLPSGAIQVGKRTVDAVSEGGVPIDPGQLVRVVEVRSNRVIVRPVEEDEIVEQMQPQAGDDLSQPIESLGLEDFEDPLV